MRDDEPPPLASPTPLARAESLYLDAREAHDRAEIARWWGGSLSPDDVPAAVTAARAALAAVESTTLMPADAYAFTRIQRGLDEIAATDDDATAPLVAAFTQAAGTLTFDGRPITRLAILARLATELDPDVRRALFMALEPLWIAVDGDGGTGGRRPSPYRELIARSTVDWSEGRSPIAEDASGLGVDPATIEHWCVAILEAWREGVPDDQPVEPWNWWWANGELLRRVGIDVPLSRIRAITDAYLASLGADLSALGVVLDIEDREGRPAVVSAETTFGRRPRRLPDGSWTTGQPTVFASYVGGDMAELNELIHEAGHAIHIAAIRTRPALTDWPDSTALTEAFAEVIALDSWRLDWLNRWVGVDTAGWPPDVARRAMAPAVLDAAWGLFEIRLHAAPSSRPNDLWAAITSQYLGIVPHPDLSWWAIRFQLVSDPGYMVHYPVGSIIAADLRAGIRAARGDWIDGDPGWYAFASEHLYRFGLERTSGEVIRSFLGRPPDPAAFVAALRGED